MRAGGLDRRMTLERFTSEPDPIYGTPIKTWAPLATVWAEVRQQSGREYLSAQGAMMVAERLVVFFIRWYPDLTVQDRVVHDGRVHDIREVREIGRRDGVELHCKAAG